MDGTNGADYATHLFEIAQAASVPASMRFAIGLAVHRSQLEERLTAILNPGTPRHATTTLGRFMAALPMLFVALAAGAVQITAKSVEVPFVAIKIPADAMPVRAAAAQLSEGPKEIKTRSATPNATTQQDSQSGEFNWMGTMHGQETIEVHIARGSIHILPSGDDVVRIQARTDHPLNSEVQRVSIPGGMKFCNVVTTSRATRNYCYTGLDTSHVAEDEPTTDFVLYVPVGLHVAGSTVLGDITAEHPNADVDMATIGGNITVQLAPEQGADFKGNLIEGAIDSDFPLHDNTPPPPPGPRTGRPSAPRIVDTTVGSGGPHITAMVVNGTIRLLRE